MTTRESPDEGETELAEINAMLDEGQGDDDGTQILPDFEPGMSVVAKVERCLFLLEKRRDVISAYGDERLFDDNAPMADGEIKMTAAENVLAWLLIEKIGVPDDVSYSPHQAQKIIENALNQATASEAEATDLRRKLEEHRKALEPFAAAKDHFDGHVRDDDTVDIALRHIRARHVRAAARALSERKEGHADG